LGISANAPVRTVAMTWLIAITAGFGAFVAARQSWLQWYPPEVVSCGRDFYGMIENFPLQRAIPMIFKGSGDCTKIEWTFLGGSIANWSFAVFMSIFFLMIFLRLRDGLFRTTPNLEALEPIS
jgi:disulfide bond formation protein DsbB